MGLLKLNGHEGDRQVVDPAVVRSGSLLCFDQLDYEAAWDLQHQLVEERRADRRPDTLVLVEHPPTYTIGRSGRDGHWGGDEHVLRQTGYPVYRVERGGSITYHGPGQIVGYPILQLKQFCSGPKEYIRLLEQVLIRTLAHYGLAAFRLNKLPGVWVNGNPPEKIAAMGVRIQRGITMHGFALNVAVDVSPFGRIVPCGIPACRVTSMAACLGGSVDVSSVRQQIAAVFGEVFGLEWIHSSPSLPNLTRPVESAAALDDVASTLSQG